MKKLFFIPLVLFCTSIFSQAPNNGFYVDALEEDLFKIPNSDQINHITINNRTYETYFYATETTSRQIIFMEGSDKRQIMAYIEGGYLIVGAHNVDTGDYEPVWAGTFFRKPIVANTWYHLALVFDNAQPTISDPISVNDNTALKFYLDGILQDEKAGFQIGGNGNHNELVIGAKDNKLWFPTCATWTNSGLSEYCFGETINEDGGSENYFNGYLWGFRVWNEARSAVEVNNNKTKLFTITDGNLLAVLDGDTVTYLDNNSVATEEDNKNPSVERVWEGNISVDWMNPLNWQDNLIPDNGKQERVKISKSKPFYPELTSQVVVGDLLMEDNSTSITIKQGGLLDVAYDVVNEGSITIENNGSLIIRENKPSTGAGIYTIKRDSPDYSQDDLYSIWSTPVSQAESQLNTIFDHAIVTYAYDASQNPAQYVYVPSTETMEVGRGYFVRPDVTNGVSTNTFSGQINTGDVPEPIYYNSPTDNWNLLGNPYASPLNWFRFQEANSDLLDGTVYFWNHTQTSPNSSSDYISFNTTGSNPPGADQHIGTAQGFFVMANQAGTVKFKNEHRSIGPNDQFFKDNSNYQNGRSWFRITGENEYSSILIGFMPEATNGFDTYFDTEVIDEGNILSLYSLINDMKLSIQGRSELNLSEDVSIPLGFNIPDIGNYTISIDQEYIDPNYDIILDDTQLNIQTDLRISDYEFMADQQGENVNRFVLKFNKKETLGTDDLSVSPKLIQPYFRGDHLEIINKTNVDPSEFFLYDLNGRLIFSAPYKKRLFTANLGPGIYLIAFDFFGDETITKKVIKR